MGSLTRTLGSIYGQHLAEHQQAADLYRQALINQPGNKNLIANTGVAYILAGQEETGLHYFQQLASHGPLGEYADRLVALLCSCNPTTAVKARLRDQLSKFHDDDDLRRSLEAI
jgi:Flp pilus assembly protein TadD